MSEMVRAVETFACEHGLIHWHSEYSADAVVVRAFPQFFEPIGRVKIVGEAGPEISAAVLKAVRGSTVSKAPAKKAAPRKAANG